MPVIPALKRLKQVETRLGYKLRPCFKKTAAKKKEGPSESSY
jgi:hypothetical protein